MSERIVPDSGVKFGGLRWKRVMRWDRDLRMLRIARVMWEAKSNRGHEIGHKLSLALWCISHPIHRQGSKWSRIRL